MAVRFKDLEAWQDESEPRRREAAEAARSYADWLIRGVPIMRTFASSVLNNWYELTSSQRTEIAEQAHECEHIVSQSRELLASWAPLLDPTIARVHAVEFERFAEAVNDLTTALALRLREQAHRAESLTAFVLEQPGVRDGVNRSMKQIEQGNAKRFTSAELRERAGTARH